MKIAIVGSRDYPDMDAVREYVRRLPADTILISGGARGVDTIAETEGRRCGLQVVSIPAQWTQYGKQAGMIRNGLIVDEADKVVAFWDGKSPGTKNMIKRARRLGKPIEVMT